MKRSLIGISGVLTNMGIELSDLDVYVSIACTIAITLVSVICTLASFLKKKKETKQITKEDMVEVVQDVDKEIKQTVDNIKHIINSKKGGDK